MTMWELASLLRRHWIAAAAGALVSVFLLVSARSQEPVYSGEVTIAVISNAVYTDLRQPAESLIVVAGIVAEQVDERDSAATSTDAVSLVGEGVRRGWSVTLPNSGGQWVRRNEKAQLRVQAVGDSETEVRALLETATTRVDEALVDLQATLPLTDAQRIRTQTLALAPVVSPNTGSPPRALAAAVLIGGFVTTASAMTLERLRRRHPAHRQLDVELLRVGG